MTASEFLGDIASRRCRCNVVVNGEARRTIRFGWRMCAAFGPDELLLNGWTGRQLGRPGEGVNVCCSCQSEGKI